MSLMLWSAVPSSGQAIYQRMRAFTFLELSIAIPSGALCEGTNGALYGLSYGGGQARIGTVFRMNKDGNGFAILKSFSGTNGDGMYPGRGLLLATNGSLYGTTYNGGSSNQGTVFRIDHSGSNYAVIKSFTGTAGDGASPPGPLMQASDGVIYGATSSGGDSNLGTVFRINPDGSGYAVLKSFAGGTNDGANPVGGLIQGTNGMVFGTTWRGGVNNQGTVFTLNPDGSGYQVLKSFTGTLGDGAQPYAALVLSVDGLLYGTTYIGGNSNLGTVFRLNQDGSGYQVIKSFAGSNGANPFAPLIFGTNGVLYGTTQGGGDYAKGTLFQIDPSGGGYQVIKSFQDGADGNQPAGELELGSDGMLYGMTSQGGMGSRGTGTGQGTAFKFSLEGSGYTVIWNFSSTGGDGVRPTAPLLEATNGCLYGTTQNGGAYGEGSVFKINRDGTGYSLVRSFAGINQNPTLPDGAQISAGLMQATDGALYGTASYDYGLQIGFAHTVNGNGTIFKLNLDGGGYQVIKRFTGGNDGRTPYAGLVQATNGLLYGTTMRGGANNVGVIFRLNLDGTGYSVLKSFAVATGNQCQSTLLQASDGRLYGTTVSGGSGSKGTVFRLNLDGTGYQVLKHFSGTDGALPWASLIQGLDGALYGTTGSGGGSYDAGTVFRLNLDGSGFAILKRFTGINGDGRYPQAALVQGRNGILYGTTSAGGTSPPGVGTIFQLNPDGSGYAVLRSFIQDFYDGIDPKAALIQSGDGTLYGTTSFGGIDNQYGTIFSLIPPAVMLKPVPAETGLLLSFFGLPGHTYTIQWAPSISGPWGLLGNVLVDSNGVGRFEDLYPPATAAFYRTTDP